MIKSLEIKNVQSHESTKLEFKKGVNVIIGSSNQGKSAVLRALYWVRTNRPLGIDNLASHWIVNDKGNLTDAMSVKLVNDKGSVERKRTKDENQYIVNGDVLNVVKTDVPEQVSSLLNLSDTNVQKQLDSPFLLSQTSGEVAKYFNQIVNLDVIDKVLTNAETKRRKLKSNIETGKEETERLEKRIEEFSWIDDVLSLVDEHVRLEKEKDSTLDKLNFLGGTVNLYCGSDEWIEWCKEQILSNKATVIEVESLLSDIQECDSDIGNLKYLIDSFNSVETHDVSKEKRLVEEIQQTLSNINSIKNELDKLNCLLEEIKSAETYDFSNQQKWINKIEFVQKEIDSVSLGYLKESINEYNEETACVKKLEKDIKDLKLVLPNTCPLCGSLLEDGKCVSC